MRILKIRTEQRGLGMSEQQTLLSQGRILISGALTFTTVARVLAASHLLFPPEGPWHCDFSQVTACDSAGVALLVEWLKWARQKRVQVRFDHLPQQLESIAMTAGLRTLLEQAKAD